MKEKIEEIGKKEVEKVQIKKMIKDVDEDGIEETQTVDEDNKDLEAEEIN